MIKQMSQSLALGGIIHLRRKKKEADSGSTLVAPLRARESASPKKFTIRSRFNEAKSVAIPTGEKFEVVLIQEGLGNLNDCFYYTKEALKDAAALFNGAKCFADHPTETEEEIRPERSTRDILGYYEDVAYQEENGRGRLVGKLPTVGDASTSWARALLTKAIDYAKQFPDSEFVGLSINASGEAVAMPIEDFIRENRVPGSVLPKLQMAQEQGISEIRVVRSLRNIVSCDLVTDAGAGGKILKMIEQERKPMKKKVKESDKHEADKQSEKSKEGEDAGHDDEEQDKALFGKMVKQYLGDEHGENKEALEMAKEAHEAYQSEGMEGQEAYEAAGKHLQMAAKIGAMKQKKEADKKEAEKKESEGKESDDKEGEDKDKEVPSKESEGKESDKKESEGKEGKEKKEAHKESASLSSIQKQLITANAEIAKLKESQKKVEITEYLEKKMQESKKPVSVTKKFREALGTPKSKAHIDESFKIFLAAYEGKESEDADGFSDFVFTEKNNNQFTESNKGTVGDLADCVD